MVNGEWIVASGEWGGINEQGSASTVQGMVRSLKVEHFYLLTFSFYLLSAHQADTAAIPGKVFPSILRRCPG
jgi:hypothetical protein